jgi:N-acetylglutamate synthase-like GNAT family acetyltransferase
VATSLTESAPLIRAATASDAESVFGLLGQLAASYPPNRVAFEAVFPVLVIDPDAIFLVCEVDGVVRGYALAIVSLLLHTNGRSAQLQELVVDENARGTGIGTALVARVEGECRALNVRQLTVASRRAAAFYEARGYGTTADYLKRAL